MKKNDISLGDLKRILFGQAPEVFLLEVFVRSVITYIVLLIALNLLGKRMTARLTNTEHAVMLMFGAVVSSAMQMPERGILESCFVLFLMILLQRGVTFLTLRSQALEDKMQGKMNMLVKDGVLQLDVMAGERISRNQLFRLLRSKDIRTLGEIKRLYMETSGSFSLYKNTPPKPGLSVLPKSDGALRDSLERSDVMICYECGTLMPAPFTETCPSCHNHNWTNAVK